MAAQPTLGTFATLPPELHEHIWRYVVDDIPPATDPAISTIWKRTSITQCSKQIQEEVQANVAPYPLDFTLLHVQTPADLTPRVLVQKPPSSLETKTPGLRKVYAFPRHLEFQLFNAQDYDTNIP
jgi:hypothetical protein